MSFITTIRHSVFLLSAVPFFGLATGALFPIIALRLEGMDVAASFIGLVTSFYYAGSVLGTITFGIVVRLLGYRTSFAISALIAAIATYALTWTQDEVAWLVFRFVGGYALGAYYIVVDSWFQVLGNRKSRGKLFAVYETVRLAATALGPFLLVLGAIESSFILVACAYMISILPAWLNETPRAVTSTKHNFSGLVDICRCFPFALIVAFCGGLSNASFYGLSSIYAINIGLEKLDIAFFVAFVLIAPALSQVPLGMLADRTKRMSIAMLCGLSAFIACFMLIYVEIPPLWLACLGGALVGGCMVPMYAFGLSRIVDSVSEENVLKATTLGLLSYNLGALVGPVFAGISMEIFGPSGLYFYIGSFAVVAMIAAFSDIILSTCCPENIAKA